MEAVRPIRSDADYRAALSELERFIDAPPAAGTPEEDRYDILFALVDAWEHRHHRIEPLDPVDTLSAYMEEEGLSQAQFAQVIGSRSHASEILNRRRALSLRAIRRIVETWKLPAEDLLPPYPLQKRQIAS